MRAWLATVAALLLAAVLYLSLWPVPVEPVAWTPLPDPGLTGPHARNERLAQARLLAMPGHGPEDVTRGPDGWLYTGLVDGRIVRFDPGSGATSVYADTGGRPLGLQFDAGGQLIVADAQRGLLAIAPDGETRVLTDAYDGVRLLLVDDLDIARDGTIWFSDASQRFPVEDYFLDFWEGIPSGRLLSFDPRSGETRVWLEGLSFANGVALGPGDDFVLVTETLAARVVRLWLHGARAGEREDFVAPLPGYPDNLSYDGEGLFWIAMPTVRLAVLERYARCPWLRTVMARLPGAGAPQLPPVAWVVAVDLDGRVRYSLQDWSGRYSTVTSVNAFDDALYLGTIGSDEVAILPRP